MRDHFGFLAPYYDRIFSPPDPARLVQLLDLPARGRLLDAGGGTGRVSAQLRPLVDELVVSDLSPQMLTQATEKNLCCGAAVVQTLPFPAETFERVLVVDALHHFGDQRGAVAELVRVLKSGGRLVIEEPDLNRLPVKILALIEKLAMMESRFYRPAEIAAMVAAHGPAVRLVMDGRFAAWVVADKQ